jgi:hypothetical protein
LPRACIDTDKDGYERALAGAPAAVVLPGETLISTCLARVRTDADLQNLGGVVHRVAEGLATRARAQDGGDARAAVQLGFLSAAISRGAARSNGISAELARRIENTGTGVRDGSPTVARALDEGLAAGAEHG